jgi:hypothetical protein
MEGDSLWYVACSICSAYSTKVCSFWNFENHSKFAFSSQMYLLTFMSFRDFLEVLVEYDADSLFGL